MLIVRHLAFFLIVATATAQQSCVVSALEKVYLNASCAELHGSSSVNMAGMQGEREQVQLVIQAPASETNVLEAMPAVGDLVNNGHRIPSSAFRWLEVGYVNARRTTRYSPSGGGWLPDPLLASQSLRLRTDGGVSVVWLSLDIPRGIDAGVYKGVANFTTKTLTFSFDVSVEVWDLVLPSSRQLQMDFKEIWSFNAELLQSFYGKDYTNATKAAFFDMMTGKTFAQTNTHTLTFTSLLL